MPLWAAASIALMLAGALGPWVKGPLGVSVGGTDGSNDGWVVVGAALVAGLFLYPYVRYAGSRMLAALGAVCAFVAVATAAYDRNHVSHELHTPGLSPLAKSAGA